MKILVNRELCEANQVCVRECPEVFSIDGRDELHVATLTPDKSLRQKLERAVLGCPRRALTLVDDEP